MADRDGHHAWTRRSPSTRVCVDLLRAELPGGRRAHRRGGHATRCRATPRRSAGRWATPSSRPCSWRWPASSGWPRAAARPTPAPRCRRPSRAPTRWAAARPAAAGRSTRCSSAYRVGARVAWRELAAHRGRRPGAGRHGGGVRRAGLRLHRRALGRVGRRARRRAGDHRPGPAALPRPARPRAAARRPGRRPGRGRRARGLEAAVDADRRGPAGGAGAPVLGLVDPADPAAERGRSTELGDGLGRAARAGPGRPVPRAGCCAAWPDGEPWPGRRGRGWRCARRTTGRCGRSPLRSGNEPVDTEQHLPALVLAADPDALADLRAAGPRAAGRPPAGRRREADRDAARLAAAPGPARRDRRRRCSCTRRRCATASASCASCTATGSRTPTRCWP